MIWKAQQEIQQGKYIIEQILGGGGFGVTYSAREQSSGSLVAIKTLNDTIQIRSDFEEYQNKFIREAFLLAKCSHPHIIKVFDVCREENLWCMVMEYIEGLNLEEYLQERGFLTENEALVYIQQIGKALTYIHQQGFLHRDVKPANIMLSQNNSKTVLIDFGLARDFVTGKIQSHTNSKTESFAPIEQYERRAKRGAYTDVYALAATLYYLLTNKLPFPSPIRKQNVDLIPPQQHNPQISDRIDKAILKGMELEPDDRPQSVQEWLKFLLPEPIINSSFSEEKNVSSPSPSVSSSETIPPSSFVSSQNSKTEIPPQRSEEKIPLSPITIPTSFKPSFSTPQNPSPKTNNLNIPWRKVLVSLKFGAIGLGLLSMIAFFLIQVFNHKSPSVQTQQEITDINSDRSGSFVINPQFDDAGDFSEGRSRVLARVGVNKKWGYIDKSGNFVIKPQFDSLPYSFLEGLALVNVDDKWGYVDKSGNFVIKPQFDSAASFSEGLALVKVDNKYGYIDKSGNFVIKPQFDQANDFSEELARVEIDDKYGYIDKSGNFVIKAQFDRADDFSEELARVEIDDKYGYIDKNGKFVVQPQFDSAASFSEGLALVKVGDKDGYIDKSGKFVIKPQFDSAASFSEGLALVKVDNKYGYIDKSGDFVIQPQFYDAASFSEGLAWVKVGDKDGYIDKSGDFVIQPQFYDAHNFSEGLASVRIGNKWSYIENPLEPSESKEKLQSPEDLKQSPSL